MPTKEEIHEGYEGSKEVYLEYRVERKEAIDKETHEVEVEVEVEVEAEVRAFEARQRTESDTNKTVCHHSLGASVSN